MKNKYVDFPGTQTAVYVCLLLLFTSGWQLRMGWERGEGSEVKH